MADRVVPTHVGVNRGQMGLEASPFGSPHARGGEPEDPEIQALVGDVVPTHVGVNRHGPV